MTRSNRIYSAVMPSFLICGPQNATSFASLSREALAVERAGHPAGSEARRDGRAFHRFEHRLFQRVLTSAGMPAGASMAYQLPISMPG